MCGIVGILANEPVALNLVEALRRLEYRGYDSAGIALLSDAGVSRVRAAGKLGNLDEKMRGNGYDQHSGMGHTRWATHGAPTEPNAHPHQAGSVVIVHNGIIENFRALKEELEAKGRQFATQTDTEVVAHLIDAELETGKSPKEAAAAVLPRLEGAFAFVIMFAGYPDLMIGARRGSPLAIGHGDGEVFMGSDAIALAPFTNRVTYLEEGDWTILTRNTVEIFDENNNPVDRGVSYTQASALLADKGGHKHFMAKEIAEQPEVVGHTLAEYVNFADQKIHLPDTGNVDWAKLDRITITACGTAYYAGLVAKYWIERIARLPVEVDIASEFRYREAPLTPNGAAIVISQSGETADTLAALRYAKAQGQTIIAVVNVPESTIARESDVILRTYAGPEIGVASTKAFTCQMTVLACLALHIARQKNVINAQQEADYVDALQEIPRLMVQCLKSEPEVQRLAASLCHSPDVLYLGRGINFPIAMEGALKLKEISYIHAEGYAAGELKHGPIALIDDGLPVVVIAPADDLYDKTISNMEEVAARGAHIILITDAERFETPSASGFDHVSVPKAHPFIAPLLFAIPIQQLAYHAAVSLGTDVDQPRNLAKSVTVE